MPEERYSCISAIGPDKVGIFYEGSTAHLVHLVFLQVWLSDISN